MRFPSHNKCTRLRGTLGTCITIDTHTHTQRLYFYGRPHTVLYSHSHSSFEPQHDTRGATTSTTTAPELNGHASTPHTHTHTRDTMDEWVDEETQRGKARRAPRRGDTLAEMVWLGDLSLRAPRSLAARDTGDWRTLCEGRLPRPRCQERAGRGGGGGGDGREGREREREGEKRPTLERQRHLHDTATPDRAHSTTHAHYPCSVHFSKDVFFYSVQAST